MPHDPHPSPWTRLRCRCPHVVCWDVAGGGSVKRFSKREHRQLAVYEWAAAAFGEAHANSPEQRGVRFLEEAIELYQAVGGDREMAHRLLDFIFERPAGTVAQEVGGAGLTLLALSQAVGVSADDEEWRELRRVLSKPLSHFTARNEAKNAAGFDVTGGAYPTDAAP